MKDKYIYLIIGLIIAIAFIKIFSAPQTIPTTSELHKATEVVVADFPRFAGGERDFDLICRTGISYPGKETPLKTSLEYCVAPKVETTRVINDYFVEIKVYCECYYRYLE